MMGTMQRIRLCWGTSAPTGPESTETFGQAAVVLRESYSADIDWYRAEYGKEEGERRFFAEHAPTEAASIHSDSMAAPPTPPFDPFAPLSIDAGLGW